MKDGCERARKKKERESFTPGGEGGGGELSEVRTDLNAELIVEEVLLLLRAKKVGRYI